MPAPAPDTCPATTPGTRLRSTMTPAAAVAVEQELHARRVRAEREHPADDARWRSARAR